MKREFDLVLPEAGKAHVTIEPGKHPVDRKTYVRGPCGKMVPVKTAGHFVRVPVWVDGVAVMVDLESGGRFYGRSCCKWPDVFKLQVGKKLAMRQLTHGSTLSKGDRKELFHAVMRNGKPFKARKAGSA